MLPQNFLNSLIVARAAEHMHIAGPIKDTKAARASFLPPR